MTEKRSYLDRFQIEVDDFFPPTTFSHRRDNFHIYQSENVIYTFSLSLGVKINSMKFSCGYKGPVKLMQRVKIAHSFLQSVSDQFHVVILSLPM